MKFWDWHISKKNGRYALVEKAYCMMMDLHEKEIRQACRYMKENGQLPYVYIHSDSGSQYTSTEFREILKKTMALFSPYLDAAQQSRQCTYGKLLWENEINS